MKQNHDSYLPRLGAYYSLLGQFYMKQEEFENAAKCFEATLSVWQEYGMDQKEQGYVTILQLQKQCMSVINNIYS